MKRLSLFLMFMFLGGLAFSATTPNSVITAQTPQSKAYTFSTSPGTMQSVYTAGVNGSKVVGVFATTTDPTTAHPVECSVGIPASSNNGISNPNGYAGTYVNVPVSSGFSTSAPPVNIMSSANWPGLPLDSDGNPFLYLPAGGLLECTYQSAITSGTVTVTAVGADF